MTVPVERRIRIVVNPNAGSKVGWTTNTTTVEDVRTVADRFGLGDDIVVSGSEEEAQVTVREAVACGYDAVVAGGGDGTVRLVARELVDSNTALGILPMGSVMNVARMLGLPRELDGAARTIATGVVRSIDVALSDDRVFLEAASIGLGAALFRDAERIEKRDHGSLALAIRTLVYFRPTRIHIELDDRSLDTHAPVVAVANGPYTGLGFTVAPEAILEDGQLDVQIFRLASKWELIRHFAAIAFGRRRYEPRISNYRSSRVRIDARKPLPVRIDGENCGTTPVAFAVRPRALRVLVAAEANIDALPSSAAA
jgi:YegS/Rv2252/BmrU family lipid kinase